jgi:asparagine synthase (glutamine-hydrolysing)
VPLDGDAMMQRVEEAVAALDMPSMDGINTYFVSWAAREVGLKVALSGLGGDELFGGYKTFVDTPKLQRLELLAQFVPGAFRRVTSPLVRSLGARGASPDAGAKAAAAWLMPSALPHPYFFARLLFPPAELAHLTEPRFRPSTIGADGFSLEPTWLGWLELASGEARKLQPVCGVSWMELRTYMASTLLRDTDAVSMARSLEVRVPLLDSPVVEFLLALPDVARQRDGRQKALLVEALADVLPAEILTQKKRTFTLPWEDWLRGPLRSRIEASLRDIAAPLKPHLKGDGALRVWNAFLGGETTWSRPWSLYVLNEWCRRNLGAA